MLGLLQGDLGYSFAFKSRTVNELLRDTFPVSLQLGSMAFVLALGLGVPAGILAAARRGSLVDRGVTLLAMCGIALPSFVISVLLIIVFALLLRLLPATSVRWEQPRTWVLPTLALAFGPTAIFARYTRSGMLDELERRLCAHRPRQGAGSERIVLYRHVLKAALLPVVTVAGPIFAAIATGSFLVETIFAVPGMGRFL